MFCNFYGNTKHQDFPIEKFALWHSNQIDYEFCTSLLLTNYAIMLANECYNHNNIIMINLYDMDSCFRHELHI